jgi:hypothetical protein
MAPESRLWAIRAVVITLEIGVEKVVARGKAIRLLSVGHRPSRRVRPALDLLGDQSLGVRRSE